MVNYSYSVAVLEETKMHCSSETVVPIWDFECESALLNLGFARSFKVSRFVNILFLPWIFWNKSLILLFFFLNSSSYLWWMDLVWCVCYFCEGFGFWSAKLKQWGTCELPHCFTEGSLVEGHVGWLEAVPCRSVIPAFSCCMCCFVWMMRFQDWRNVARTLEGPWNWPSFFSQQFSCVLCSKENFFYSWCSLVGPSSRVEKVHKFLQEENISRVLLLEIKHRKALKLNISDCGSGTCCSILSYR